MADSFSDGAGMLNLDEAAEQLVHAAHEVAEAATSSATKPEKHTAFLSGVRASYS